MMTPPALAAYSITFAVALFLENKHDRAPSLTEPTITTASGTKEDNRDTPFRNSTPDRRIKNSRNTSETHTSKTTRFSKNAHSILNINFGKRPEGGPPNGVVGGKHDIWTLVDVGERKKKHLQMADGTPSDIKLKISENDGEWGIPGNFDVYHAYIYHNCRCVDLSVTLKNLPAGMYQVFVLAHGDAPEQNAAIEIRSAGKLYTGKKTLNDGSAHYRERNLEEGNQYIRYLVEVESGIPMKITSRRDGSSLSMFNAIQIKTRDASR